MQFNQRAQSTLERERRKLTQNSNPSQNNNMCETRENDLRTFTEMTTKGLMDQNERTTQVQTQVHLHALQRINNSHNVLKTNSSNGRDISSNHSENNNGSSTSRIPKPSFLPRDDIQRRKKK